MMMNEIAQHMHRLQDIVRQLDIHPSDNDSQLTEQYGYLKFDEDPINSTTSFSQYIRLALQTKPSTVVEFMEHGWRLPRPDLIISVTGGGKLFQMSAHLRRAFQHGVVVAAATTNAWLITTGVNTGVVKEVGEALNNYRYTHGKHGLEVPCIGIGSWNYTAGCEYLASSTKDILSSSNSILNRFSKTSRQRRNQADQIDLLDEYLVRSYVPRQQEANRRQLEPNHTHFLLFDDGGAGSDRHLSQRAEIESYARLVHVRGSSTPVLKPIVMVLVEGGPFSIRTVCQALESNVPLVVIKESGRAADLIADLHACFSRADFDSEDYDRLMSTKLNKNKSDLTEFDTDNELITILEKAKENDNPWIDDIKYDLCRILRHQHTLVTIFQFDGEQHQGYLENAILEALLNAAKLSETINSEQNARVAQMKLAIAWKKYDYAKRHILTYSTISKWEGADLYEALLDALNRDCVDFVSLLIDYGAPFEKITGDDLNQLYLAADNGLPTKDDSEVGVPTREDYYKCYSIDQFLNYDNHSTQAHLSFGKGAATELFFWAIFLDRFELAKYFCSKTWNQSVAALIASNIYFTATKISSHSQAKRHYLEIASKFDLFAASIIDRCFSNDETFGVKLLTEPAIAFNNAKPLKIAEQIGCPSFLASNCVQRYLDYKWFGHINYKRKAIFIRVFLCAIFIPLIPIFAVFLPYVSQHKQIARSNTRDSKHKHRSMIRLVIVSDHSPAHGSIHWTEKITFFYRAPIVRFYYNVIFLILFLGLYSFVLLFDYFPLNVFGESRSGIDNLPIPITEILLHICVWSLIVEEIRQFKLMTTEAYFSNIWNCIDLTGIIIYCIGFAMRFVVAEGFFVASKIFLCLDLIIWYVTTLRLFSAFQRLGPKLLMIFNTMKDLLFFLCFILIFLCAFSITSWSLVTSVSQVHWMYNANGQLVNATVTINANQSWSWTLLREITHYGVWKVFAQIDPIEGTDPYSNVAFILAIVFVAISNILLLNVLIALFNVTIQDVQVQSHQIWRYQRFFIVDEFSKKTPLPPPFNIVYYLFNMIRFFVRRMRLKQEQSRSRTTETLLNDVKIVDKSVYPQLKITNEMQRESAIASEYWRNELQSNKKDQIETALTTIERKIDNLKYQIDSNNSEPIVEYNVKEKKNMESDV